METSDELSLFTSARPETAKGFTPSLSYAPGDVADTPDGQVVIGGDDYVAPDRLSLRDYQRIGCDRTWQMFYGEGFDRLLGVAATGSGKTIMFADLARRAVEAGGKALVLVDQEELVFQAVERIRDTTGYVADIEQAENHADPESSVIVSTVQSMRRRLEKYHHDNFSLVVADEADRSAADQWRLVLGHFDEHAKILGVTATPKRADRKDIMEYYQAKAFEISLFDLIRDGYLSRIKVRTVPLKIDISGIKQTKGDYDAAQLDEVLQRYFGEICEAIKLYALDRKILIFWPLIRTSMAFVQATEREKLSARHIDGQSANRRLLQEQFRSSNPRTGLGDHDFNILSNALLLSRGWDEPSVDCVINCRVTRHETMYRQVVGRGTRIFCPRGCVRACDHPEAKRDLLILDFLWQFEKFNVMRPADLIAKNKKQAKDISAKIDGLGEEVDLEWADDEVAREIENTLVKEFARKKKKRGTLFDALEWAANMDIRELVDWEPETARDLQPITDRQEKRLERMGFLLASVKGFGHAERIIEIANQRIKDGLASFKQVHWLRRFGVVDAWNVNFVEASKLLDRFFNK
jgi:superfamily II DNA or RNA helicase